MARRTSAGNFKQFGPQILLPWPCLPTDFIKFATTALRQCWIPFWIHSSLKDGCWMMVRCPISVPVDFHVSQKSFPGLFRILLMYCSLFLSLDIWKFIITTNTSSPVGNGPQKSTATRFHDSLGVSVMTTGVLDFWVTVAWQARHPLHLTSIFLSTPGNQTVERRSCLLFTMHRCPSWQMLRTWSWSACGITICVPLMATCSTTDRIFLHMVRGVWVFLISHGLLLMIMMINSERILSFAVASWTSFRLRALGTQLMMVLLRLASYILLTCSSLSSSPMNVGISSLLHFRYLCSTQLENQIAVSTSKSF